MTNLLGFSKIILLLWGRVLKIKNYLKIKQNKPFEINDIFIYLLLIVTIFVLFLFFVFLPKNDKTSGFAVYKGQDLVLTFYNQTNDYLIQNNYLNLVDIKTQQDGVLITVFTDQNQKGYNVIFINTNERFIKMHDSTCSQSKDCVHSPAINNSGMIYCAPHDLKLVPLGQDNIPPWTGGA